MLYQIPIRYPNVENKERKRKKKKKANANQRRTRSQIETEREMNAEKKFVYFISSHQTRQWTQKGNRRKKGEGRIERIGMK